MKLTMNYPQPSKCVRVRVRGELGADGERLYIRTNRVMSVGIARDMREATPTVAEEAIEL